MYYYPGVVKPLKREYVVLTVPKRRGSPHREAPGSVKRQREWENIDKRFNYGFHRKE